VLATRLRELNCALTVTWSHTGGNLSSITRIGLHARRDSEIRKLPALSGTTGPSCCVTSQALPPVSRSQSPDHLCLLSPALIIAHSVSGEHFVQQHRMHS
jgi:hypothetical protein